MIRPTKIGVPHVGFPKFMKILHKVSKISHSFSLFCSKNISNLLNHGNNLIHKKIKLWRNPKNMMKKLCLLGIFGFNNSLNVQCLNFWIMITLLRHLVIGQKSCDMVKSHVTYYARLLWKKLMFDIKWNPWTDSKLTNIPVLFMSESLKVNWNKNKIKIICSTCLHNSGLAIVAKA